MPFERWTGLALGARPHQLQRAATKKRQRALRHFAPVGGELFFAGRDRIRQQLQDIFARDAAAAFVGLGPPASAARYSCRREPCTGRSAWLPLGRAFLSAWIEHLRRYSSSMASLSSRSATLCMTIAGLRTCERPTAWLAM